MISVVLVPIVNDKRASVCSTSNYRPIALASIMSKLLEKIILNRISDNLVTNPNQFGFKPKHNTEMYIFALKEAILKYRALNCNVYSCFLSPAYTIQLLLRRALFRRPTAVGRTRTLSDYAQQVRSHYATKVGCNVCDIPRS